MNVEWWGAMACGFIFPAQEETAEKMTEEAFQGLGWQPALNASYNVGPHWHSFNGTHGGDQDVQNNYSDVTWGGGVMSYGLCNWAAAIVDSSKPIPILQALHGRHWEH